MKSSAVSDSRQLFSSRLISLPRVLPVLLAVLSVASAAVAQTPSPTPADERGIKLGRPGDTAADPNAPAKTLLEAGRPELVLQTGHAMKVDGIAFSPDGRLVASGSADNTVKLWESAGGRELRNLTGHRAWVKAVAFSGDGKMLASGAVDGSIRIWEVNTGKELRAIEGAGAINAINLSPDGRTLAVGTNANLIKLFDVASGAETRSFSGHTNWVLAVAFSPDGKQLASGSRDNSVKIWETASGRELFTLAGHADRVKSVAFSPDGRRLASASFDRTVKIWDAKKGREARTLTGHTGKVLAVTFTGDGRRLISGAADKRGVKVWEVESGRQLSQLEDASSIETLEAVAFSVDGRYVASSSGDKTVLLRDLERQNAEQVLSTRSSGVYATAFSRDGKWFASGGKDNALKVWEVATGRQLQSIEGNIGWLTSLSFSVDSRTLAAGGLSGQIKIWELETGRELRTLNGHAGSVNALAVNTDGQLASASNDKTIKIWGLESGSLIRTLEGHGDEVHGVAFSPDGRWIASGSADKTVKLWDANNGQAGKTLSGHSAGVYSVAFSPDGKLLASASYDKSVRVWDAATGGELKRLDGQDGMSLVSFSPAGRALVVGSLTGRVNVWDTNAQKELYALGGHTGAINGAAFSTGGRWFATASEDGSCRLWETDSGQLMATLVSLRESGDWIVVAPDGLFDGSPEAWNQILWRFEQTTTNVKPVEVFFNEFYYPGLLADILGGKRPKAARDITLRDRRQPQVKLAVNEAGVDPSKVMAKQVSVRLEVEEAMAGGGGQPPGGSGARDLRLFRNGSLVRVWRGDVLQGTGGKAVIETTVPLVAGENQLTAYAFNRDNVKSVDAELSLRGDESIRRRGKAYIVAVGLNQYANPNFNLRFAVADALVFGEEVQRAQAKVDAYAEIEVVPLHNKDATKDNILLAIKRLGGDESPLPAGAPAELEKLKPSRPEDTVIVYYAGHGLASQNRFYLIPHDLGYTGKRTGMDDASVRKMLSHSVSDRELEDALDGVDAAQIVMVLDACNSGQALEADEKRTGPMNSKGLAQLAYEKGMFILTAAQSYQAAQEVATLGHGLLTHALVVQGLKEGTADSRPKDGQVVMGEWLDYATARVPQMQLEKMKRSRGLLGEIAFVEGEEKIAKPENRSLQRPRVFYRRELAARPLVVTKLGATAARSGN